MLTCCSCAGFGRSRFFSRAVRKALPWLHPPRWLFAISTNAFVDQVLLLCTNPSQGGSEIARTATHDAPTAQRAHTSCNDTLSSTLTLLS